MNQIMEFLSANAPIITAIFSLLTLAIAIRALKIWKEQLRTNVHLDVMRRLLSSWSALQNARGNTFALTQVTREPGFQKKANKGSTDPNFKKDLVNYIERHLHAVETFRLASDESEILGISEAVQYFKEILIKNQQEAIAENILGVTQKSRKEFVEDMGKDGEIFRKWIKETFSDSIKIVKIKL